MILFLRKLISRVEGGAKEILFRTSRIFLALESVLPTTEQLDPWQCKERERKQTSQSQNLAILKDEIN